MSDSCHGPPPREQTPYHLIDENSLVAWKDMLCSDRESVWKLLETQHQKLLCKLEEIERPSMSSDQDASTGSSDDQKGLLFDSSSILASNGSVLVNKITSNKSAKTHLTPLDPLENLKQPFSTEALCISEPPLERKSSSARTPSDGKKRATSILPEDPFALTSSDMKTNSLDSGIGVDAIIRKPSAFDFMGTKTSMDSAHSSRSKPRKSTIRIRTNSITSFGHSSSHCNQLRHLKRLVKSDAFEVTFAILILASAIVMCVEAHYRGLDSGYALGAPHMSQPASDAWPGAEIIFRVLDWFFGVAFTMEVTIKCVALRISFVRTWWNLFDAFIALSWILNAVFEGVVPGHPFGVARLARLLRLLRLVKTLQVFDALHLMVASLRASMSVLIWSIALLLGIMASAALLMTSGMTLYISDKSQPENDRLEAFAYFGTFSRSLLSIFELTLGNWTPITRFLHESVSEWFGMVIMAYHCIVSFAVVMVIRGVFLHEVFEAAESDDDLMILRQMRRKAKISKKMHTLFHEADETGNGYVSHDEFIEVMKDDRVKAWLAAMDLEVSDADVVFEMVDRGDHRISVVEFVDGLTRLKGAARSIDLVQVLRLVRNITTIAQEVAENIGCEKALDLSSLKPSAQSLHILEWHLGHMQFRDSAKSMEYQEDENWFKAGTPRHNSYNSCGRKGDASQELMPTISADLAAQDFREHHSQSSRPSIKRVSFVKDPDAELAPSAVETVVRL